MVDTIMTAVPGDSPVTTPPTTVATAVSLELQLTLVFVAFPGVIVGFRVVLSPSVIVMLVGETLTR